MLQITPRPVSFISLIIFLSSSAERSARPWRWKSIAGNLARVMLVLGSFIRALGMAGTSGVGLKSGCEGNLGALDSAWFVWAEEVKPPAAIRVARKSCGRSMGITSVEKSCRGIVHRQMEG